MIRGDWKCDFLDIHPDMPARHAMIIEQVEQGLSLYKVTESIEWEDLQFFNSLF